METVFDRAGEAIAWRRRDILYNREGECVGFVRRRALFSTNGACVGFCEDGLYRDLAGAVVAFELGATGGPLLPQTRPVGVPPIPRTPPNAPDFETPPPTPMRKMSWSATSWAELLG